MSLSDKHTLNTKIINFGPITVGPTAQDLEQKYGIKQKVSDSFYIQKKANGGWTLLSDVDENGKVFVKAIKTIGRLGRGGNPGTEASIEIIVQSTQNRVPLVKAIHSAYTHEPKWIEVNDEQNRSTKSFAKEKETYEHTWQASSVLETQEFFSELFPQLESLLNEKLLQEYSAKISDSASKVQKPYNRNYVVEE